MYISLFSKIFIYDKISIGCHLGVQKIPFMVTLLLCVPTIKIRLYLHILHSLHILIYLNLSSLFNTIWKSLIQFDTIWCNTIIQFDAIWYNLIQYNYTIWYNSIIQFDTFWYNLIQYNYTIWYNSIIQFDTFWYN